MDEQQHKVTRRPSPSSTSMASARTGSGALRSDTARGDCSRTSVVGREHVSLLIILDTWQCTPFMGIGYSLIYSATKCSMFHRNSYRCAPRSQRPCCAPRAGWASPASGQHSQFECCQLPIAVRIRPVWSFRCHSPTCHNIGNTIILSKV